MTLTQIGTHTREARRLAAVIAVCRERLFGAGEGVSRPRGLVLDLMAAEIGWDSEQVEADPYGLCRQFLKDTEPKYGLVTPARLIHPLETGVYRYDRIMQEVLKRLPTDYPRRVSMLNHER